MDRVVAAFESWIGADVVRHEEINCHHNYTEREKHRQAGVVSRKGAISARHGEPGLIPGSMGTASYVVVGKGNPVALVLVAARCRACTLARGGPAAVHP